MSSDNDAVSEYFINLYSKVFETAAAAITSRFRAEDLKLAFAMERVLLKGTDMSLDLSDAMRQIEAFFPRDVANGSLGKELAQLSFYIASKSQSIVIIDELINVFRDNETLQILLPNVFALLKLFLVLPCTTCEAERSFSALRRIKTYLRSSMTQARLNHAVVLHVHKDRASKLDLTDIINRWIDENDGR